MDTRKLFHLISYLQYPLVTVAGYYALKPYWNDFQLKSEDINLFLVYTGLAISFSGLQDTSKTQNKMARKIWQSPKKGRFFLRFTAIIAGLFLIGGIIGLYSAKDALIEQISIGLIALSIGFISMLKTMIEMFENHRLDKNPLPDE